MIKQWYAKRIGKTVEELDEYDRHISNVVTAFVKDNVIDFLSGLKREHHINDDCWYSCPESGGCCNYELEGCDCGADDFNQKIDDKIKELL